MATDESAYEPDGPPLGDVELGVLEACDEAATRRRELLPALAAAVGVSPDELFYTWTLRREWLLRRCGQHGPVGQTGWVFYFHGLECDLKHPDDGRLLRFDFGPGGRVDTFTAWGVFQFIETSTAPWPGYPELKRRFTGATPFDRYRAMSPTWDRLEARGAFEPADPGLVAFLERHTAVGQDGLRCVRYPPGTPERIAVDCSVAHRPVLSAVGLRLLEAHRAGAVFGRSIR